MDSQSRAQLTKQPPQSSSKQSFLVQVRFPGIPSTVAKHRRNRQYWDTIPIFFFVVCLHFAWTSRKIFPKSMLYFWAQGTTTSLPEHQTHRNCLVDSKITDTNTCCSKTFEDIGEIKRLTSEGSKRGKPRKVPRSTTLEAKGLLRRSFFP